MSMLTLSSNSYYRHSYGSRSRRSTIFDLCPDILLEIISYLTLSDLSKVNCHLPYIRSIIKDFRLKLHGGQLNNMKDLREISSLSYRNQIISFDIPSKMIYHINPRQYLFLRSLTIRQLDSYEPLLQVNRELRIECLVLTDFHPSCLFILREHLLQHVFMRFSYLKQMEIISKTSILSAGLDTTALPSLKVKNLSKLVLHLPNEWLTLHKLLNHLPQLRALVVSSISCEHAQSLAGLGLPLSKLGLVRIDLAFERLIHMPTILDLTVRTPQIAHLRICLPHKIVDIDSKHLWWKVVQQQCPKLKHVLIGYWPVVCRHHFVWRELTDKVLRAVVSLQRPSEWRRIHWEVDPSSVQN